jgi:translation initiation factor IF-2
MELKGELDEPLEATVMEAKLDKRLGVVMTALISKGIVANNQVIVAGHSYGKVRFLANDRGTSINEAGPSQPVRIVGLNKVPNAGDRIVLAPNERTAAEMASAYRVYNQEKLFNQLNTELMSTIQSVNEGSYDFQREVLKVPILVKADVPGSLEAILSVLKEISSVDDRTVCKLDFVSAAVGDITTSDIQMAAAFKAKVIGFNVGLSSASFVRDLAKQNRIDIQFYHILYELTDAMKKLVANTLSPLPENAVVLGTAEVKKVFPVGKNNKVAGCIVTDGVISKDANVRVMRNKKEVYSGTIFSLKMIKEDREEVETGQECGIQFSDSFNELEEGDVIQSFVYKAEDQGGDGGGSRRKSSNRDDDEDE